MTKKTPAEVLAQIDALMRYAPDLFDEAVRKAADKIGKGEVEPSTLEMLLGPQKPLYPIQVVADEVEPPPQEKPT